MNKKSIFLFTVLILLLAVVFLLSISIGSTNITFSQIFNAFFSATKDNTASIILQIRLPRLLLAIFVGMGLSASGCVFQSLLRNPLADPYTLGISGGAAFGAAVGIISGISNINIFFLPASAFAGTLLSMAIVYSIASKKNFATHTLILTGVILGFVFSSFVLLLIALSSADKVHATILWLMGDLSSADTGLIKVNGILIFLGIISLMLYTRELNILSLGEEKAYYLGINVDSTKKKLFIIASIITAACVSVSGIIGFVGLIIPHALRQFTGHNNKILIPASVLAGAILLTLCDLIARVVMQPIELPVGVITGLIGGLLFLFFIKY